jgi:hypothetical protein
LLVALDLGKPLGRSTSFGGRGMTHSCPLFFVISAAPAWPQEVIKSRDVEPMIAASILLFLRSAGPNSALDPFDAERQRKVIELSEESTILAYEDREFVKRLNTLLSLLHEFTSNYAAGKVDVKRIREVQKAWHDLEKSEWFKPPKVH